MNVSADIADGRVCRPSILRCIYSSLTKSNTSMNKHLGESDRPTEMPSWPVHQIRKLPSRQFIDTYIKSHLGCQIIEQDTHSCLTRIEDELK